MSAHDTPAQPSPHPRGVFLGEPTMDGLVSYRVYTCKGRLIAEGVVVGGCVDAMSDALWDVLDEMCPDDHGPICRADRGWLRVLP